MNFLCYLAFVLAIYSLCITATMRSARRRRRREAYYNYNVAYNTMMQDRNLATIRNKSSIDISSSDHYGFDGVYNRDMCGYMGTHVFIDGTRLKEPVSNSVKQGFIQEYFAKIYTPINFPLTYRKESVYIDENDPNFDEILWKYYFNHCVKPNLHEDGGIYIFFILFFLLPFLLFR